MASLKRPYLIIPKLIEQPTWGGDFILQLKHWQQSYSDKKIGQSYELFSGSKLATTVTSSADSAFNPEFGTADKTEVTSTTSTEYIQLAHLIQENTEETLGKSVLEKYQSMPLLIKINQAYGNSFQLHIKPGTKHSHWQPKPESWYYFANGLLTFGVKKGIDIEEYKRACVDIDIKMRELSNQVLSNALTLEEAKKVSQDFIRARNPWQYVNVVEAKKHDIIDLSIGAIHHSWEEDRSRFPDGNILYEVQLDVMDPVSTLRSFDQGKFKADGSVRNLNIDDYFTFIDTDPEHNNITNARRTSDNTHILATPYYAMDRYEINDKFEDSTGGSFCHLYVEEGDVDVIASEGMVKLTQGHSCFMPQTAGRYEIKALKPAMILKTYIPI